MMTRFMKNIASKKGGLSPGSLIHIGEKKIEKAKITLIDYDSKNLLEKELEHVEESFPFKDEPTNTWLNIDGLHNIEIIEKIGTYFDIHPLVMEDILNTGHRPKLEDFEDYLYIVFKMLYYDMDENMVKSEQISIILSKNYLISFQEIEGDVFNPLRERIRKGKGRIRKMGSDYLAYALIDATVDQYFMILEKFGEEIESLEEELLVNPTSETLQTIHNIKREMIYLRKNIWPMREIAGRLRKGESDFISDATDIFFADIYDHVIQIIDTIESFRDILSGMLDLYLSTISNKMNEVMKVLTIIATFFIPLTFIAGVYGMNFKYMPELEWRWGYPGIWILMGLIMISLVFYFKKKRWI
jgi:magnesium transporter